jgi:hypothetical protein
MDCIPQRNPEFRSRPAANSICMSALVADRGCFMISLETRPEKACFSMKPLGHLRSAMVPRINLLQRCCAMFAAAVIAASVAPALEAVGNPKDDVNH